MVVNYRLDRAEAERFVQKMKSIAQVKVCKEDLRIDYIVQKEKRNLKC
jgi:hypothetical protein